MTIQQHFHNILTLLDKPLSIIELAEAKCLPPALGITNISILWCPHSEKSQKALEIILKTAIRNNELNVLSVAEWSRLIMDWEKSRDAIHYKEPGPSGIAISCTMTGIANTEKDLLPDSAEVKLADRKMYVVHIDQMKKWLQKENEWPLPDTNLLSHWWPETRQQEYDFQVDNAKEVDEDNYFRLETDYWQIRYIGKPYSIKQSVGMRYITNLIQRAYSDESEIDVVDLYYLVNKRPAVEDTELNNLTSKELVKIGLDVSDLGNAGDIMTPEGKKWIRSQMQQLFDQIEDAKEHGHVEEALRLREKKEHIEDYIKKSHGVFGRTRKVADENERIRKAVSRAIYRALDKLGRKEGDNLAVYLDLRLNKSIVCSFRKDPNIDWKIIQ